MKAKIIYEFSGSDKKENRRSIRIGGFLFNATARLRNEGIRSGLIAVCAETYARKALCASVQIPRSVRRSEHRDIGSPVAVIVGGSRRIAVRTEIDSGKSCG